MEWILVIAVVAIGVFIYNGFRTRCPLCGRYTLHPRDKEAEDKQKERYRLLEETGLGKQLDEMGSSLGSSANKPGYTNRHFICKSCGHHFDRKSAVDWLTASNKIGEEAAIREYKKVRFQ